ncbi:MarR family winged helix-turn-helix transcriptional regulator [Amycolatopsis alkalitolerans]|uniref:MarR family transcriptional regulator n=1 Tax=Amycolatopsis alkalitolerans TaxID=2547244 RepID=A0A5C4M4A7_9PSEU|nr:MarR family transcriptional regulator [Amycolatopsis alkalitolerans]TNC27457.1 MarR family transcriptional regulator [Amycolatopsis alkalitolerans]
MVEVRWLTGAEQDVWRAYVVAGLRLRHRLHRELSEAHDVSLVDYELLVVLQMQDGRRMRMSDLAAQLGSTKSRLSHQVARMEAAGLLRRLPDPEDKRGVIAELAPAGEALLTSAAPTHVHGVRRHLIDLMSPEEQRVIGTVFSRVLEHLTALPN